MFLDLEFGNNTAKTSCSLFNLFFYYSYISSIDIRNAPGVSASASALAYWARARAGQAEKVPSHLNRIMPA